MWCLQQCSTTALEYQSSDPLCLVDTGARKQPGGGEERKYAQEEEHGCWITANFPLHVLPCSCPPKRGCPELPRICLVPDAIAVLRWRDQWQQQDS